jgi:hypothetical protein
VALRHEHSRLRPQPPRLKDTKPRKSRERSGERDRNHDAKGRWAPGNKGPKGRKVKQLIKRYLGSEATGAETEALTKDTLAMFRSLCKSMGSEEPAVQDTLARRARWGVLSARYALRAAELGLDTPAGMKALDLALKLDQRCERLDVTALDLANKLQRPEDPRAALSPFFTTESEEPNK